MIDQTESPSVSVGLLHLGAGESTARPGTEHVPEVFESCGA